MVHSAPSAHVLKVSCLNHGTVPHAVLVLQSPAHHVSEDLRVIVRVSGEAAARFDQVVVHYDERMKAIVVRIVIVGEGKGKPGVKPTVFGLSSFLAWSLSNFHAYSLTKGMSSSKLVGEIFFLRPKLSSFKVARVA